MANPLLAILKEISPPLGLGHPKTLHLRLGIMAMGLGAMTQVQALTQDQIDVTNLLTSQPGLDTTQTNMSEVIGVACPPQTNEPAFQARCNGVVTAAAKGSPSATNALQVVSPEQMPTQGISATRTSISAIGGRLAALRAGVRGFQVAGLTNGQPLTSLASLSPYTGGSAGEASSEIWNRLGVFVNGNYNTGNVDSTFNQLGFNFNSGTFTTGVDYRLTKDLILGTAFSYTRAEAGFANNGGSLNSNAYTGAVYGTYYATNGLYFDGIATFGGINYDSTRNIQYSVPTDPGINTQAKANPNGNQFAVSLGSGYNFALQEWTLNPYARVNYIKLNVDGFSENGGDGWGMRFSDQYVESVTTTLGTQISYALSTPWGVFLPNVRGEWYHQYKDDSRNIPVRFLGDTTSGLAFNTVTNAPTRNYYTVGTGVSGTFAKGFTAFLNYDTLLGYSTIESHLFTVGARLEF